VNNGLLYAASALTGIWGVAHLAATKGVVSGFGQLTTDNRRIITMEWGASAALIALGAWL
jgi:hypothetical protein